MLYWRLPKLLFSRVTVTPGPPRPPGPPAVSARKGMPGLAHQRGAHDRHGHRRHRQGLKKQRATAARTPAPAAAGAIPEPPRNHAPHLKKPGRREQATAAPNAARSAPGPGRRHSRNPGGGPCHCGGAAHRAQGAAAPAGGATSCMTKFATHCMLWRTAHFRRHAGHAAHHLVRAPRGRA